MREFASDVNAEDRVMFTATSPSRQVELSGADERHLCRISSQARKRLSLREFAASLPFHLFGM